MLFRLVVPTTGLHPNQVMTHTLDFMSVKRSSISASLTLPIVMNSRITGRYLIIITIIIIIIIHQNMDWKTWAA